jgi:hypothetical protein
MNTSSELVQQIDALAKEYGHTVLVVGFPRTNGVVGTEFPKARLGRLDELLRKGGVPIAFVSRRRVRGIWHFRSLLLDEVEREAWARLFIITFVDYLARSEAGEAPTNVGIAQFQRLLNREKRQRKS